MRDTDRLERLVAEEVEDCCRADVKDRLDQLDELKHLATERTQSGDLQALGKLGDDTRHAVMQMLHAADNPLCVCELEPMFDVSESALSHALSDLADAGLVKREKEGKWRYYRPTDRGEALIAAFNDTN